MATNVTSNCTAGDGGIIDCDERRSEQVQVLISLGITLLVFVILYLVHRGWQKNELKSEKAVGVLNEASGFAANLVRHFSPNMRVAKYQFRGMSAPKAQFDIAFKELGLNLHNGAKVLSSVSGEFKAGRMCAIMGPSGAGKTTFMNVLCGKATYGKMSGSILINGHSIDIRSISSVVGFVPQDDIVHEVLTVREQIRFSALLRNKVGTSRERIERITDDVVNVMQIDHIQNTVVGGVEKRGISGGQRKRVNIGLELAAQPTVLFLDEPTSGLDSTSSLAVVYSLKKMCQLGMSCIMVIHQPRYSLFTLFDDVLLLGKGGHAVYLGGSLGAKDYFYSLGFKVPEGENLADWFMDVIAGEVPNDQIANYTPAKLFDLWEDHGKEDHALPSSSNGTSSRSLLRKQSTMQGGRASITETEDIAVLTRNLQDEWDHIDINKDGFMDTDELKTLLTRCSKVEPSDEIVDELIKRMAGPNMGVVTKGEFIKYLLSLKQDIAMEVDKGDTTPPKGAGVTAALKAFIPKTSGKTDSGSSSEEESTEEWSSESENEGTALHGKAAMTSKLTRSLPGLCGQWRVLGVRTSIAWWRGNLNRLIFFAALSVGAVVLAVQDLIVESPHWDAMVYVNNHTCIALLVSIYCLAVFGENQPVFWRERNRGLNVMSYFLSKSTMNNIDVAMQCFLFTAIYYSIRGISLSFFMYFIPHLLVGFAASGWGYTISAWLPYTHGPFVASLIMFVVCGLLGNPFNLAKFLKSPVLEAIVSLLSITRWSIPMSYWLYMGENHPAPKAGDAKQEAVFQQYESSLSQGHWTEPMGGSWWAGIIALLTYGTVLRLVAYLGLRFKNLDKQV